MVHKSLIIFQNLLVFTVVFDIICFEIKKKVVLLPINYDKNDCFFNHVNYFVFKIVFF